MASLPSDNCVGLGHLGVMAKTTGMNLARNSLGSRDMTDEMKNAAAHLAAWIAAFIGTVSFEMWIALAGLLISAFISLTNYRSRKLQDQLLRDEAARSVELHALEMARLIAGIEISPAVDTVCVEELVNETTVLRHCHAVKK